MSTTSRVFVTGATGFVGRTLTRKLLEAGRFDVLAPTRAELDLEDREQVTSWFATHRPSLVFMLAGKVGGIAANMRDPVGFLADNARMLLNLFEGAARHGARKCVMVGSSTIYPSSCPQPMKEEYILTGAPDASNAPFAFSKLLGIQLARAYRAQYGLVTTCPVLCNIYGEGDHFEPDRSTVVAALVRRFVDARIEGAAEVVCWGSGIARREFLHVDDLAEALILLAERDDAPEVINVGSGVDVSVLDLATLVREAAGFQGKVVWDTTKPDGMLLKCTDVSRLRELGFAPKVTLEEGLTRTVRAYESVRASATSTP